MKAVVVTKKSGFKGNQHGDVCWFEKGVADSGIRKGHVRPANYEDLTEAGGLSDERARALGFVPAGELGEGAPKASAPEGEPEEAPADASVEGPSGAEAVGPEVEEEEDSLEELKEEAKALGLKGVHFYKDPAKLAEKIEEAKSE